MKTTSQILRQLSIVLWNAYKGLPYSKFETPTMLLGGRGSGPGEGAGASFAGRISWSRFSRPPASIRDVPFVTFSSEKVKEKATSNKVDSGQDVPFVSFCSQKQKKE